jgi:hypothetical protein
MPYLKPATPADLLDRIAARYRGDGLTLDDRSRLVVHVIAGEFGVHPNSIYIWAKRYGWRRPSWYEARRPKRRGSGGTAAQVGAALLAAIVRAADAGAPCPSNVAFARQLGSSTECITLQLRQLYRDGAVVSETRGPMRRLVLKDGRATAFTRLTCSREPQLFRVDTVERTPRPNLGDRLDRVLTARVRQGLPMPGNAELGEAIGCAALSVRRLLNQRVAAGAFKVELAGRDRRVVLPDGRATPWAAQLARAPFVDPTVRAAIAALRRCSDVTVYDMAIRTCGAWGLAWFLNGRTVSRDELLAAAAARQARALEQRQVAA